MKVLNEALLGLYGRSWIDGRSELRRTVAKAVYVGDIRYHAATPARPARITPSVAAAIQRRRSERSSEPKSGPEARPGGAASGADGAAGSMRPATGRASGLCGGGLLVGSGNSASCGNTVDLPIQVGLQSRSLTLAGED